jgi:hypothetical protein
MQIPVKAFGHADGTCFYDPTHEPLKIDRIKMHNVALLAIFFIAAYALL